MTEPHAPVHDILRQAGLVTPIHHEEKRHSTGHPEVEVANVQPFAESPHYGHRPATEVLAEHQKAKTEEVHKAIEEDFAKKLMQHKQKQTGHEFRLFGHTMVSYDQLMVNVKQDQCVKLTASHQFHTERTTKWICQKNLDEFWDGVCITMDPHIELCDEKAIAVFLGKCTRADNFEVCPSDPVVVEHLKTEEEPVPAGCKRDAHGDIYCKSALNSAFEYGSCFKVDQKFICEEDMDHIGDEMCVTIGDYEVCNADLVNLFHGEQIKMDDGHAMHADFPRPHYNYHTALCRHHEGEDYCLEDVLGMY